MTTTRALVLGGGADVWEDVRWAEALLGRPWDGVVIAANDIGVHWPRRLDHWVTLHPRELPTWVAQREALGFPRARFTWARAAKYADMQIEPWPNMSSGGLGVQVALERVQASGVILCGIPMDRSGYFAETTAFHQRDGDGDWSHADKHWRAWVEPEMVERLTGRVKSFGGRTRELLGAPTRDWLMEGTDDG